MGANLEDSYRDDDDGTVMEEEVAVERVRRALGAAVDVGVPDFVLNARSDTFLSGRGDLDETVRRGRRYLEAGATTVFVFWPAGVEMVEADVKRVIDGLDKRANIQPRNASQVQTKALTSRDIARLGAARVSVGPQQRSCITPPPRR